MIQVLSSSWSLLLGLMLLMLGNGLQGTLLGIRGGLEGFTPLQMSIVMSGYFLGFLGGSKAAPELIRRVGHIRVFAALGSIISAVLILYPVIANPIAWTILRVCIGFSFSAVYVTTESWLNNAASNENRGKALSMYLIVQMIGIIAAQGLIAYGDPSGYVLFVIPSVLVSVSFLPILLSVSPTPAFATTKAMTLRQLYKTSPLGVVGVFLLGGVFSAQFGMASVYGTQAGLSVKEISLFVSTIYIGALVLQYPIGWMSDRMDRRVLIMAVSIVGFVAGVIGLFFSGYFPALLVVAFLTGGMSNPLYSLLLAYTNDFLEGDDMAAASGGLIFINGIGAISGPLLTGWIMQTFGASGFWIFIGMLMGLLAAYAGYRMTRRRRRAAPDRGAFVGLSPSISSGAIEAAHDWPNDVADKEQ